MFRIELVDIGGDGNVTHFDTSVDTLAEAEVIAKGEISGHIGTQNFDLIHDDELVYDLIIGGVPMGVVQITSL